jgi:hypothetical protein
MPGNGGGFTLSAIYVNRVIRSFAQQRTALPLQMAKQVPALTSIPNKKTLSYYFLALERFFSHSAIGLERQRDRFFQVSSGFIQRRRLGVGAW